MGIFVGFAAFFIMEKTMRVLNDSDLRALGDGMIKELEKTLDEKVQEFVAERNGTERSGTTTRTIPWIWYTAGEESGLGITDGAYLSSHVCIRLMRL